MEIPQERRPRIRITGAATSANALTSPSSSFFSDFIGSYRRSVDFSGLLGDSETESLCSAAKSSPRRLLDDLIEEGSEVENEQVPFLSSHANETSDSSGLLPDDLDSDSITSDILSKSSFSQSVFNAVNILMGIAILSLPFAFKMTGWILGLLLLALFCLITRYTAILLARLMDAPRFLGLHGVEMHTYADIGEFAFGKIGRTFISFLFLTELIAASVAFVILMSDSIEALYPEFTGIKVKLLVGCLLIPTTWPSKMSVLAYGSILGIVSLVNLGAILLYDGLSNPTKPGSLLYPEETMLWPDNWLSVPIAFGLIMAGFCGHSVFPSLYKDMRSPKNYPKMVDISYVITFISYAGIGAVGYLMFGQGVLEEITLNLPLVKNFSPVLTRLTIWFVAVNPATKFALTMKPVNVTAELWLFNRLPFLKSTFSCVLSRTLTSSLALFIAIIFPGYFSLTKGFHHVMSLLGSVFAFTVSVWFPCLCYIKVFHLKLDKAELVLLWLMTLFGFVMAAIGGLWSIIKIG